MSFYGTSNIGFEPFSAPPSGYTPAQPTYPAYPPGPPPVQQPMQAYAGYPPAPQPLYPSLQQPSHGPTAAPVYPPPVNAYSTPGYVSCMIDEVHMS
jgi:hypothetical protein